MNQPVPGGSVLQIGQNVEMPAAGMNRLAVNVVELVAGGDLVVVAVEMLECQEGAHPRDAAVDRSAPAAGAARLLDQQLAGCHAGIVGDELQAREE